MDCKLEMRVLKNGYQVRMDTIAGPEYVISTDVFECANCQAAVMLPAQAPIAQAFESHFSAVRLDGAARFIN